MFPPNPKIVRVFPLAKIDGFLDYRLNFSISKNPISVGSLVRIPLRNRIELGIVQSFPAESVTKPEKLKSVLSSLYSHPVLSPSLIKLAEWIRTYYACSWQSVLEIMIPLSLRKSTQSKLQTFISISQKGRNQCLDQLPKNATQQRKLLKFLQKEYQPVTQTTAIRNLKISTNTINVLTQKGWLKKTNQIVIRKAYDDSLANAERIVGEILLNKEQKDAINSIKASLNTGSFQTHLVHGVTGSGKTEVYLGCIESVLEKGGGVLFLVPEVALTPQTVDRLRSRLKRLQQEVVVWHSHLSAGERHDAWLAVTKGESRVVVGARSAVFAPIPRLRLIIVDEEHEPAFKQEENPRYHGRDVAVYRAFLENAVCVLGSATPSLESLRNANKNKYQYEKLAQRVDHRSLPRIQVLDLRRESRKKGFGGLLSLPLEDKLRDRWKKKEQSILFMNRRGYHAHYFCQSCGYIEMSPDASIPLTYHRTDNTLRCHITGFIKPAAKYCSKCEHGQMTGKGTGTQRIEEAVKKSIPQAKVVRMDADTMVKKNKFRQILQDFRLGKIDILVGTQMIAKGLDFPNVTLVGMIDADRSLHIPDFRAAERTFQLIVQVSGRAGRGERSGEVLIQSYTPHAEPIQYARRSDFDGFFKYELERRQEFSYPPFRHVTRHIFRSRNEEKVCFYLDQWIKVLEEENIKDLEIRGPAPAPIAVLRGEYRFQVWYFTPSIPKIISKIQSLMEAFPLDREVLQTIDVDAQSMS